MLLDVMMPEIDGFEVCRTIKSDPETQETLVIFLSALGEVSDKVAGLKLGAVDYITKPIQAEEVLARVEAHLMRQYVERELHRSRDRLDRELAAAAGMQRLILPPVLPCHLSRNSPRTIERASTRAAITTMCWIWGAAATASSSRMSPATAHQPPS